MLYGIFKLFYLLILWLDLAIYTVLMTIVSFLPRFITQRYLGWLFQHWCQVFVRAFNVSLRVHQRYRDKLPKQAIYIANHPSAFEDIGMPAIIRARFLAKYEVKNWWIVGRIATACGSIYVKREEKSSREQAGRELLDVLKGGDSIALYPEGGCMGRRIHTPFRHGVFRISMDSGVPIVPVFLHYEAQADFEWGKDEHLLLKMWRMLTAANHVVQYHIYDPIDPAQFSSVEHYCQHVEDFYKHLERQYLL